MRTRHYLHLSPDHVNALSLVEIDFYGSKSVLAARRELKRHFDNSANTPQWHDGHRSLLTKLPSEMADHLGYKISQLDVFEGGYVPEAWQQSEEHETALRLALGEVLNGKRPIPVRFVQDPPLTVGKRCQVISP